MNDEEERRAAILAARRKHQLAGKKASATKENRKSCPEVSRCYITDARISAGPCGLQHQR